MSPSKRILLILGFGAFFITLELLSFRSLNRGMDRLAHGLEANLRSAAIVVEAAGGVPKLIRQKEQLGFSYELEIDPIQRPVPLPEAAL
jgi:hypothetical protein